MCRLTAKRQWAGPTRNQLVDAALSSHVAPWGAG